MSASDKPKKRPSIPPEKMTGEDALAALIPGHDPKNWTVDVEWEPWKSPKVGLRIDEIDDIIDTLAKREGNDRLEDRDLLAEIGILCPYFYVRISIARAVSVSKSALINEESITDHIKTLKRRKNDAQQNAKRLEALLDTYRHSWFTPASDRGLAMPDFNEEKNRHSTELEAHNKIREAITALNSLAELAASGLERFPEQKATANEWACSFCETLGFVWTNLTGKARKSPSDDFVQFVKAAYTSLGGRGEISWENQTRRAFDRVKTRQRFNQFDRDILKITPPGLKKSDPKEYKAFHRKRKEEFESNVKTIEDISKSIGHPLQSLAQETLDKAESADYGMFVQFFIVALDRLRDRLKTEKPTH